MADVFVSYSRADQDMVQRIVALLEAQGWMVWWDTRLDAGESWDITIEREIKAARSVVVVWTPRSVGSEWVREEAHHGRERGVLVPVLLDLDEPPFGFRRLHAVNLTGWDGVTITVAVDRVLAVVRRRLGGTTSGSPDESKSDAGEEVSLPATDAPIPAQQGPITRGSRRVLEVVWNGSRLPGKSATDVYVAALCKIGLERVAKEQLSLSGAPLVSRKDEARASRYCHGWYVATHSDTPEKYSVLQHLKERLGVNQMVIRLA